MAAGLISPVDFVNLAERFMEASATKEDGWKFETAMDGSRYLVRKVERNYIVQPQHDPVVNKFSEVNTEVGKTFEEEDPACVTAPVQELSSLVSCEYHVVYSPSYSVPVLYFNMHKHDGRLLSLEEVWENVPQYYRDRLEQERWTFITQQEHPLIHRPFFQLHPCHTADLMKNIPCQADKSQYLISWLSAVGPVVGLDIPLQYGNMNTAETTN